MKTFITENFLLQSEEAQRLYHDYAKKMPIIDYHNHLSPKAIAQNESYSTISDVWLAGDHYKWRGMRAFGVEEKYITGNASAEEKFLKWAEVVPYTVRNPLYHWTHLELLRYFDIDQLLNPQSAKEIYNRCNELLSSGNYNAVELLEKINVELLCTTDDPIDNLEWHSKFAAQANNSFRVLPAWRPDKAMAVDNPETYNAYLDKLGEAANIEIHDLNSFYNALESRHQYFHDAGCRLSDHGLEYFHAEDYTEHEIKEIFVSIRNGKHLDAQQIEKFRSAMLQFFAIQDAEKGWTQQFHFGVLRNNNTKMFKAIGPDTGFDSIGDFDVAKNMSQFFDKLAAQDKLTKTILYPINPKDNETVATMIGNFNDSSAPGKIQFGSGWWFLDQKDGMTKQINALSNLGLLSKFVGMLTDSRSFMSFPRHEYFRRILCNIIGDDIKNGELPKDFDLLGGIVEDICYNNAKNYFKF